MKLGFYNLYKKTRSVYLKVRCSNKIGRSKKASKPPKPNAKSNLLVPYEDIIESPQRNAESDLGNDEVDDIDSNLVDPQLCGVFACDIYEHLRLSEVGNRFYEFQQLIKKKLGSVF